MAVLNRIAGFADQMTAWRRHLHAHPELALDCHQTAAFVVEQLRSFGVDEIHEGIATSGVVAVIRGQGAAEGAGPVTGLRADMDALPMQEATGVDWASTIPGRMHACGHDGHTAMLLGAAKYLSETRNFAGRVVLIFQPAEETIGGARIMVQDETIMERFGIEEVYALHTDPFAPLGLFRTTAGPIMAAVDDFDLTVIGKGGHAAYPDACIDPLPCAMAVAQSLASVVSRNAPPLEALVISVTQLHSGSAMNIIPGTARLTGTVRSLSPQLRDMAEDRLRAIVDGHAQAFNCAYDLSYDRSYPATINHAAQTRFAADVALGVSGNLRDDVDPEMGSEDFSYMLERRPGAFLFLGQGLGPSVHHPQFDFNDLAAPIGASFFARLIETRHAKG